MRQSISAVVEQLMVKHQIGRPSAEQAIRDRWPELVVHALHDGDAVDPWETVLLIALKTDRPALALQMIDAGTEVTITLADSLNQRQAEARRSTAGQVSDPAKQCGQRHVRAAENIALADLASRQRRKVAICHVVDMHEIEAGIDEGRHAARRRFDNHAPCWCWTQVARADGGRGIDDDRRKTAVDHALNESLGGYLTHLPTMAFRTGAFGGSEFLSTWTIFYWAWWISWTPFVGMFIARISKGRTIPPRPLIGFLSTGFKEVDSVDNGHVLYHFRILKPE